MSRSPPFRLSRFLARSRLLLAGLIDRLRLTRVLARFARMLLWATAIGHAALVVAVLLAGLVLRSANPRVTALMVWRRVTSGVEAAPLLWIPYRDIPRTLRDMTVRLEDGRFWVHPGIDLGAIRDAWLINRSVGWAWAGGSTITQQLARNLLLTPRKTYLRKYLEAIVAVGLDLVLPKQRILELYLNVIEWGNGVYGVGAAAARSFGLQPRVLSLDQQRRLAAIISSPLRFSVDTIEKSRQLSARYAYLLARFPDAEAPAPAVEPEPPPPAAEEAEASD